MKRVLFLAAVLLLCAQADAQPIRFMDSTNEWTVRYQDLGAPTNVIAVLRFKWGSDTVFNGHTWRQMKYDIISTRFVQVESLSKGILYREDATGKLWCVTSLNPINDTSGKVIYDPAWTVGSIIYAPT